MRLHFDFVNAKGVVEPLTFSAPIRAITARTIDDVMPAMRAIDDALAAGKYVAGYIAYEAGAAFDPALITQPPGDLPLQSSNIELRYSWAPGLLMSTPNMSVFQRHIEFLSAMSAA